MYSSTTLLKCQAIPPEQSVASREGQEWPPPSPVGPSPQGLTVVRLGLGGRIRGEGLSRATPASRTAAGAHSAWARIPGSFSRSGKRHEVSAERGHHRRRRPDRLCARSEEHTSELQSPDHLVCRLLLE